MGVCKFKTEEVERCVRHALASKEWDMGWSEEKPQPAILFVHDHGVYCMSNGSPHDIVEGEFAYAAYAKGCDPRTDEDHWEESRYLVGGDDFGETICVSEQWLANCQKFSEMQIKVNETSMSVAFVKPRKSKATK